VSRQFAALSDLYPGPVTMVAVAVTQEAGREQSDVLLTIDPHSNVRVRGDYRRVDWTEDKDEPDLTPETLDLEVVDRLRLSAYGSWGRHGLASALREAAAMLDGAEPHLPADQDPDA
jgi:hypothetical protein